MSQGSRAALPFSQPAAKARRNGTRPGHDDQPYPARAHAKAPSGPAGSLRVGCLTAVPQLLLALQADPAAVITSAGLDRASLADADGLIPYTGMGMLLQASAQATGCQHFGLLVGRAAGLSALGLMGRLMQNAPNLGQALRDMAENQHRYARGALSYLTTDENTATFGYAVYEQGVQGIGQIYDAATSHAAHIFHELSGRRPDQVLLPRRSPGDPSSYRRHFGVSIQFDSDQAALVFPRKLLSRPVPGANPVLRRILEATIASVWAVSRPSIADQVLRELRPRVTGGSVTLEDTAERMSMHPRTLNRRLKEECTCFRALLNQSRLEVAYQMLEASRLSVTEIGLALNYADSTSFSHAFRRFSGSTPSHWRANLH